MAKDEASTGEQAEPNTLKDRWGNERPYDAERYPDDSPAKEGHITKPSGQGGATPKSRPDHQDMFPKNAEPSDGAKEHGERLKRIEQGEDPAVVMAEATGVQPTTTSSEPEPTSSSSRRGSSS